jgi:hypothetical protein
LLQKIPFLSRKVVASKESLEVPGQNMSFLKEETNESYTS